MPTLRVVSAGAARTLIGHLQSDLERAAGGGLAVSFAPVGAIDDAILGGDEFDVVVTSEPRLVDLLDGRLVIPAGVASLGRVPTCLAVRQGDTRPGPTALADALVAADAVYCPDLRRSTAGRHLASVLEALGVTSRILPRLRVFPHGAAAMEGLAGSADPVALGCAQLTEILPTTGVTAIGPFPAPHQLSTEYCAAVSARSASPDSAQRLVAMLTDRTRADLRHALGFTDAVDDPSR